MGYPTVNKGLMQTKWNVTPCADRRKNGSLRYIVIHYTATEASAENNCIYFGTGNRNASADYFIDRDGAIWKFNGNCARCFTWQCGDGNGAYGVTNANSLGIEVVSAGSEYTQAQKDSLRALVTAIMADYGVPASRVVRHYDASRKICPKAYCGSAAKDKKWKELHAYITQEGDWSDMATKAEIREAVWGHKIDGKTAESLLALNGSTSDPTGRGVRMNDHDHIKHIAGKLSDVQDEVREVRAKLDELLAGK